VNVDTMSMKDLRDSLRGLGVDYSRCIEKGEMKALLKSHLPGRNADEGVKTSSRQQTLSIREIKERLTKLDVDYSGCVEMGELVELLVAKEQGHSANPFRGKSAADVKENSERASKTKDSDDSSDSSNSLRGSRGAKAGLRDITHREGNSQQKAPLPNKAQTKSYKIPKATVKEVEKPKATPIVTDQVKEIDQDDKEDVQACTEYVEDVYSYFRKSEAKYSATAGYMEAAQKQLTSQGKRLVNAKMRAIVVDWLVELHQRFRPALQPAALYLAINVFDRFLASGAMKESYRLQVIGAACLLVAAKIEEIYPPKVREIKKMVDGATAPEICTAERAVLAALKFQVSVPTVFHFMKRYLKAAEADQRLKALTMYIVETALHDVKMIDYKPSILASAAIHQGLAMLGRPSWTATLQAETEYTPENLKDCTRQVNRLLHMAATDDTMHAVHTKFSSSKYLEVGKTKIVSAAAH